MADIKFSRTWAMPSGDTFSIKPIKELIERYLPQDSNLSSIDPTAKNSKVHPNTITNDIDPSTSAQYHLDAREFLDLMIKEGKTFDIVILDPPWTVRQVSEVYKAIGKKVTMIDTQMGTTMKAIKEKLDKISKKDTICMSFGYSTVGMGKKLGWEIVEIMLVCHGGSHFDSLVTVERKL